VPIAWAIVSSSTAADTHVWLQALVDKLRESYPAWQPSCILVDDCEALMNAIA